MYDQLVLVMFERLWRAAVVFGVLPLSELRVGERAAALQQRLARWVGVTLVVPLRALTLYHLLFSLVLVLVGCLGFSMLSCVVLNASVSGRSFLVACALPL